MNVGGLALVIFCVFIFSADASYNRPNVPCEIQYWPLPRSIHRGTNYSLIDPNNLQIITEYSNGTIVPEQVTAKIEKIVEIHKKNFFKYKMIKKNFFYLQILIFAGTTNNQYK